MEIFFIKFSTLLLCKLKKGVRYLAITRVEQLGAGLVLGWVTVDLRPAHRSAEREVIILETVDWGQTRLNGQLYRRRLSGFSLCPGANVIQHWRE